MMIKKTLKPVAVAVAALVAAGAVHAGETITLENGVNIDWRLTTNYTLSKRLKDADPVLAGFQGGNDGNNNFDKNALTANRVSAVFESKISKGDTGFVLSGSTFYDDVYHRSNDNSGLVNKPDPVNEFTREAKRFHGGYSRILDAYGYTSFGIGNQSRATIRLGRHAVNWGEALFFPNIAMAQGPFDGTKTGVPGTETKDSILAEDQISASIEINPRWSLLGQVQYGFHPTIAAAPGSFMSSSDGVGPGGTCLGPYFGGACTFGTRGLDIEPGKSDQWALGTRYRVTDSTEVGVYYMNYSDRTPIPEINAITSSYRVRYFDDIKLLGATVSTTFGPVSAYGELTHKEGAPVLVDAIVNPATGATIPTPTRANVSQLNIGGFYNAGRNPISDSLVFLGEVSAVSVGSITPRQAIGTEAFPAFFGFTPGSNPSFKSKNGLAISGTMVLGWPGLTESWELNVPISYSKQLKGRTLLGGVGGEGDTRYSIGAVLTHVSGMSIGVTYLGFAGGASLEPKTNRLLADRNQLSLNVKYAF